MAGMDDIKLKIIADAKQQAEDIINEARGQAAAIEGAAKAETEKKKQAMLEEARRKAEEEYNRIVASGKMELRKEVLADKRQMMNEPFKRAMEHITNLPGPEYTKLLSGLIVSLIKTGREEIILSKKDRERVGRDFAADINRQVSSRIAGSNVILSDEIREMTGGFILRSGNVEINYSFEDVLNAVKEDMELDIVKMLFS